MAAALETVLIWAATATGTPRLWLISTRRTLVTIIMGYVLKLDARSAGNTSLSFSVNSAPHLHILLALLSFSHIHRYWKRFGGLLV